MDKYELPTDDEIQQRLTERLIVRLEDQLNDMAMMERERVRRFLPIVEQLAGEDEMRLLLAMLLDQSYQSGLAARLYDGPARPLPDEVPAKTEDGESGEGEDGEKKKKKRRRGGKKKKSGEAPPEE